MKTDPAGAPAATPLSERPSFLLSQIGHHAAARFAERLAPLGLQNRHFGLLSHLAAADGQTQQQLADTMGIHRNVMVGLVDDLEDRGLVQRRRHPADRRAHALHLTPAARGLLGQAQHAADEHDAEILAGLDDTDQARLLTLLQHIAGHAGLLPGVHPTLRQNPCDG
jgi:DNA-binding MarR family transcriptional regulator